MDEIELMNSLVLSLRRRSADWLRNFGITLPQFRLILLARHKGAITPSAAAEELSSDRPTATLMARKCVSRGWLRRRRVDSDRRSVKLVLTGEGEELLDRIERARLLSPTLSGDPFDALNSEERAAFRSALARVGARAAELSGGGS
jgi:DNA-binding MarR family transcriptional regulator